MPEQQNTSARQQRAAISPFVIEVETKNSGTWHSVLLHETFRGSWSRHRLGTLTASISPKMSMMPDIPGIRMKVIPKDNTVIIYDPLEDDEKLVEKISQVCRNAIIGFDGKFGHREKETKKLDADTFVSFLFELRSVHDKKNPFIKMVSGELPTHDQIATLPGRELYDVGSPYPKPRYKGDKDRHQILLDAMAEKGITI
jgi:hypothetical protein